jgi:hypothetical protein
MDDARTSFDSHTQPLPSTTMSDAVPPFAARVVALFDDTLKGVVFPGLDRSVLRAALAEVEHAYAAVTDARRILEASEATLLEASRALVKKAERAVAYARVYADGEGDDALIGELDGLASTRNARRPEVQAAEKPRGKKRGRPPLNSLPLVESQTRAGVSSALADDVEVDIDAAA